MVTLAGFVALFSCYSDPKLPHTPEAMACKRDCMHMQNECNHVCQTGDSMHDWSCPIACKRQRRDCISTCPGADDDE